MQHNDNGTYIETVKTELKQYLSNLPVNTQRQSMREIESEYDLYLLHGQLSCQRDLPDKAIRSFQECIRLNPGSFTAHTAIGLIHRGRGDYEQAEACLERAHAIEPRDFKTKLMLIHLKHQLNRPRQVTASLEQEILSAARPACLHAGVSHEQFIAAASLLNKHPDWESAFTAEAYEHFQQHKFTTLRQVVPPPLLTLLHQQYTNHLQQGHMLFQQDKARYVRPGDPLSALVQHQLCEHVQNLAGCALVPTYTIGIHYIAGGHIKPHTDRPQNELSISMCIGAVPGTVTWPLYAVESDEEIYDILQPNDAFLYRGNEIVHYRKPLPAGQTVTQLIIGFRSISRDHCNCQ